VVHSGITPAVERGGNWQGKVVNLAVCSPPDSRHGTAPRHRDRTSTARLPVARALHAYAFH
jgi:hypothetical protein